jgi:hypothetical protein
MPAVVKLSAREKTKGPLQLPASWRLVTAVFKVVDIVHQYDGRSLACPSLIQALRLMRG